MIGTIVKVRIESGECVPITLLLPVGFDFEFVRPSFDLKNVCLKVLLRVKRLPKPRIRCK